MSRITAFPLLSLLFLLSSAFLCVQGCPPHELKALLRFRSTFKHTYEGLGSWNGADCCVWEGVECHGAQDGRHVSKLDLKYFELKSTRGQIDSSLFELKHLTYLDLSYNDFHGEIPSQVGYLSSLRHLGLSGYYDGIYLRSSNLEWLSNLSSLEYLSLSNVRVNDKSWGSIVGSLLHLQHLDLSRCSLPAHTIPTTLLNLSSLTFLELGGNNLEGTIPPSLGLLTNLTFLGLGANQLRGSIPANLCNLHNLRALSLYSNQLSGSIPSFLTLPSSLQYLHLSNNRMNGTVTEAFFQKCLKLKDLDLSHSGLSINISSTWIPSFQLRTLSLKKCQIGGPIPSWISTQFSLSWLDLSANGLMGNLPSWLWDINVVILHDNHLQGSFTPTSRSLKVVDLSMNELSGHLPADIDVQFPYADVLILANNKFEGQIPNSIANLSNLLYLDMYNNRLTGNVPATLSNLTFLKVLNLENNFLEGEIPKELGILSNLLSLCIGKNNLQGILPSSLTNFSGLQVLDVGGNNLIGNIPHWIANFSNLHVLVMRSNNFRGNLPPEIGRMRELQVLDLSSNFFSGAIPHSYLSLPAMQNSSADGSPLNIYFKNVGYGDTIDLIVKGLEMHYEYVLSSMAFFDLSNNRLSGPLPPEVGNLIGLMYLNLSMNSLSGPIPHSLGNLVKLESVDLSFNKFTGQIPWEIGNLTYLARLNLSYNNLCGRIPQQGGQMLTFDNSSYIGNANLWGCPLEKNCSHPVARAPPPAVGVEDRDEDFDFEFLWYWMCFGLSVGVGFSGVVLVLVFKLSWRIKYFEVMDRIICMLPKLKPKHV